MRSRAAAKERKLFSLAAVCLAASLLLVPLAEASRDLPISLSPALEPPIAIPEPTTAETSFELLTAGDRFLFAALSSLDEDEVAHLLERRRFRPVSATVSRDLASGVSTRLAQSISLGSGDLGWKSHQGDYFLEPDPLGPVDSPNLYQAFGFDGLNVVDPWGMLIAEEAQLDPGFRFYYHKGKKYQVSKTGLVFHVGLFGSTKAVLNDSDLTAAVYDQANRLRASMAAQGEGSETVVTAEDPQKDSRTEFCQEIWNTGPGIPSSFADTRETVETWAYCSGADPEAPFGRGPSGEPIVGGFAGFGMIGGPASSSKTKGVSWSSTRRRYWKETGPEGRVPRREVLVKKRKTGTIERRTESKELHHKEGRTGGDPHRKENLLEAWPTEHELIDAFRHTGYEVPKLSDFGA